MRNNRLSLAVLAVTLRAATPAFANPRVLFEREGPLLLPSIVVLAIALRFFSYIGGADPVLRLTRTSEDYSDRVSRWFMLVFLAILFLVVLPLVSIDLAMASLALLFLALAVICLARASQMMVWALHAAISRERPAHLESIRPKRMLLCAALLILVVVGVAALDFAIIRSEGRRHGSPMAWAVSEIRNADLALTKLTADAGVKDLHDLFTDPTDLVRPTLLDTISHQTDIIYELLKKGRNANIGIKAEIKQKLGNAYMDIGLDPWEEAYQFYLGPLNSPVNQIPFRSYRGPSYVYDKAAYEEESKTMKGPAIPEADMPPAPGFPAPKDLIVYIFSTGKDKRINQPFGPDYDSLEPDLKGGGDDINNWDVRSGWAEFY